MYASVLGTDWTASFTDFLFVLQTSPFFWWCVILVLFCIIEKFDLGIHCFSWLRKLKKEEAYCNGGMSGGEEQVNGDSGCHLVSNLDCMEVRGSKTANGCILQNGHVPVILNTFIRGKLIPTFSSHSKDGDPNFSVLVLSNIPSMQKIKEVNFKQVTFNGMPLVDPKRLTYPQSYRYENYIVARPSDSEHAEVMIVKELASLLKGYGTKERCYLRTPIPQFGLLYSWALPCSECLKLVAKTLPNTCSQKFVIVYSRENHEKWSVVQENLRMLKDAGITVVKVAPE